MRLDQVDRESRDFFVPVLVGEDSGQFFREVFGGFGDQPGQVAFNGEAFGGDFGHQAGEAVGEGFEDFAFDAGAVAEGGDGAAEVVQGVRQDGDVAADIDAGAVELGDFGRHVAADDGEALGFGLREGGHDGFDEVFHRIDVGGVAEAADEAVAGAFGEGDFGGAEGDGPGDGFDMGIGQEGAEEFGFGRGVDDDAIDLLHGGEFAPALEGGGGAEGGVVGEFGFAFLAEEMDVRHVVDQAGGGEFFADHGGVFGGVGEAVEIDEVGCDAGFAHDFLDRPEIGGVEAFDAAFFEGAGEGVDPRHVVRRDEGDFVAEMLEGDDVLEGGVGAGILIRGEDGVVDEVGAAEGGAFGFELGVFGVHAVFVEHRFPAEVEFAVVDLLVALEAGACDVGAVGDAFEVDDFGGGLDDDAQAEGADAEAEVGVFVVGGGVVGVEPGEGFEGFAAEHEGGAGDVIGVAEVVELGGGGIAVAAPVPAIAHFPDDAADFLEGAVREEEAGAGDADIGEGFEGFDQGIEPAIADQGVVVEEEEEIAGGGGGAGVAGGDEAAVGFGADDADGAGEDEGGEEGFVTRAVIDDDDFEGGSGEVAGDGLDAVVGDAEFVVDGDDDGDGGGG